MGFVKVNGISIHYQEEGEGFPITFINGLADDLTSWGDIPKALVGAGFRVITFDNRGVGKSDAPEGPYTTELFADDTAALLGALGVQKSHILGTSMGGMIAQTLALKYPELVERLFLCQTAAAFSGANHFLSSIWRESALKIGVGFCIKQVTLFCFTAEYFEDPEHVAEWEKIAKDYPQTVHGYLGALAALEAHNTLSRLAEIKAPTVVVAAPEDQIFPPAQVKVLADGIPGAKWVLQPRGSHASLWEFQEDFISLLLDELKP